MILEQYKMAAMALKVVPALFVLFTVTLDLTSAIMVIDVTFPNVTQHSFTADWAYRLNGYNASRLEGFSLAVSSIYDFEIISRGLPPNQTTFATPWVESGTTFHVCIAPSITNGLGNNTCGFVTTYFDAWDLKGQMACYIGIALLLVFVVLISWDIYNPRTPSGGDQQVNRKNTVRDRPPNLTQSNMELTENMHI
ncbi:uncharacterized protein LOC119744411 [Patiria miniata]|uniref:Uncharacterized protein n=1 Tax=Patiria miniata TaxID=46514 RepID=A0A914BJ02_PATMI|nr:uncharacterized protein LOC119744411 [Patiria miniata]